MNYTKVTLIMLGVLGLGLHCLIELNKLNKANKGDYKMAMREYFKLEIFSLLISFLVVCGCTFLSSEVEKALDKIGYLWLMGFAYIFIGYSAQSLLVAFMGRGQKTIDEKIGSSSNASDNK